jgi:hypothetical protein
MQNMGMEDFSYDSFKLAYDNDSVIQSLTNNFDQNGVELQTKAQNDEKHRAVEKEKGANVVSQMAKSATKRAMADS